MENADRQPPKNREPRAPGAAAAVVLVVLFAAATWGGTLRGGFVWDDEYFVVRNEALREWRHLPRYFTDVGTMAARGRAEEFVVFRPLRNVSYRIDFAAAGLKPAWWHAHNILLHAANGLLLMLAARRLGMGGSGAIVAALVYVAHPAQSEVVAWVKGRDDLIASLFVLMFMVVWAGGKARGYSKGRATGLALLYLGALLAKEQAIALPAALWIMDRAPRSEGSAGFVRSGRLRLYAGLAAGTGIFLLWRHLFLGRTSQTGYPGGDFIPTMLTMTRVAVHYVTLLVFPARLCADYSWYETSRSALDPRVIGSALALAALALAGVAARRRAPRALAYALWIAVFLLPVSNVVPTMQYMAERFLYLPMIGFALLLGCGTDALAGRVRTRGGRMAVAVAWGVILAVAALRSSVRAGVWRDGESLCRANVRDSPPGAFRPANNLMILLMNTGRHGEALPLARDLWKRVEGDSSATPRKRAEVARNLGYLIMAEGDREGGLEMIRHAAVIDPGFARPLLDLGVIEGQAGRHEAALAEFDRAAALAPEDPAAHFNRGLALRELGRADEAEAAFRRAIERGPERPDAHLSLAAMLWKQGRLAEAAAIYESALVIWPDDGEIRHWLGQARARRGR